MDYLSMIKSPIESELSDFVELFNESLTHSDGLLGTALSHIRQRGGKRMRPILILLMAKNFGQVSNVTQYAAVGLELLHTASLVHDDVVDESSERRGQASVNATYDNKVAVLVGDYILSTALLRVSLTDHQKIVQLLADLGRTLAAGEILQLSNIQNQEFSEDVYYQIINNDTTHILFIAAGAFSVAAPSDLIPELQGRFPLRVELDSLHKEDFKRILSEPKNSLIMQYTSLLETEGVKLDITEDALDRMSVIAEEVNASAENIGARRLHTIMEKVLADINFEADEHTGETIKIDAAYVDEKLEGISQNQDLSRYIL